MPSFRELDPAAVYVEQTTPTSVRPVRFVDLALYGSPRTARRWNLDSAGRAEVWNGMARGSGLLAITATTADDVAALAALDLAAWLPLPPDKGPAERHVAEHAATLPAGLALAAAEIRNVGWTWEEFLALDAMVPPPAEDAR